MLVVFLMMSACFSVAHAGDAKAGKTKSASCAGCHGADGMSKVGIYPNLKGQHAAYLKKQLLAFRDGQRADPIMSSMAKPLSDQDIENLAAYYASLK